MTSQEAHFDTSFLIVALRSENPRLISEKSISALCDTRRYLGSGLLYLARQQRLTPFGGPPLISNGHALPGGSCDLSLLCGALTSDANSSTRKEIVENSQCTGLY